MFSWLKKFSMQSFEDAAVKRAVSKVVDRRTYYGFSGHPHVRKFESELSRRFEDRPVVGVNSGTDALINALKILGITTGDEVIVPAFSFISTVSCVSWVGAIPVFVDIRLDDYAIDPGEVEYKITSRTKAIIVAHLFGQPATEIADILSIAKRYNILVIEDVAQSFGAKMKINNEWRSVGTIGDIGCFSFSSTKPFAAPGNGGALILNKNVELRDEADRIRFYGARRHYYDYPTVGVNSKLHEIQAAALLAKLDFLDHWFDHRESLAAYYTRKLTDIDDLVLPKELPGTNRIWYRYVMRTKSREKLFDHLYKKAGPKIYLHPTKNYPVPLPYFLAFNKNGSREGDFPVADQAAKEVISLSITNSTSLRDAAKIAQDVREFFV